MPAAPSEGEADVAAQVAAMTEALGSLCAPVAKELEAAASEQEEGEEKAPVAAVNPAGLFDLLQQTLAPVEVGGGCRELKLEDKLEEHDLCRALSRDGDKSMQEPLACGALFLSHALCTCTQS